MNEKFVDVSQNKGLLRVLIIENMMSNSWVNRNWMQFHKDFKPIILWHFELQRTASMNQPPASCRSTTAENCKIRLLEFRDFHYLSPYWSEILSEEHLLFVILQICLVWIPEIVMDRLTCRFHINILRLAISHQNKNDQPSPDPEPNFAFISIHKANHSKYIVNFYCNHWKFYVPAVNR